MIANTTTKVFFNPANPDAGHSLDVRVVRGMRDLFSHYRKLGLKNSAAEMKFAIKDYVRKQRAILAKAQKQLA